MKTSFHSRIFLILFFLFIFILFPLQIFAKRTLTLRDAVETAIKNNPLILSQILQRDEFVFQKKIIRAEFFPKLYINYDYSYERRDSGKKDPSGNNHRFGPYLTWNLFSGFSTYYSMREAIQYVAMQDALLRARINDIAMNVVRAYLDYFRQNALYESAQADLEDAKVLLRLARRRYELGLSPYADVLDAEARLKEAEFRVTNFKYSARSAMGRVLVLMGEDLSKIDEFELLPPEERDFTPPQLSELIQKALLQRPELLSKRSEISAQEEKIKSIRGEYFPTVDLFASHYYIDNRFFPDRDKTFTAGIRITFPLFTGFSTTFKLQKERANLQRKNLERRNLELQIQDEVFTGYNVFLTSKENLASAKALLAKMEEDLRLIQKRYENGLASIVDVTTVLARLSQARAQVATSKYDLILNYFVLQRLTGDIPGLQ